MNVKRLIISLASLFSFALWTILVRTVDVQKIGPRNSSVGLATVNRFFHTLTGANFTLYNITDWLGLVPVAICFGFAILGLVQWIKRRNLLKVDYNLFVLGGFYILTIIGYLLFEEVVINYRPVLIQGYLEASYPSSTTLLVLCVMPTAILQFQQRIKNTTLKRIITISIIVFMAFMVIGRLMSGVHWLSDIIGGVFLSFGLVYLYRAISNT